MPREGRCELCGRDQVALTRHHLIPRCRHDKPRTRRKFERNEMLTEIAMLCRPCHSACHRALSEKQMAEDYSRIDLLRNIPEIERFVQWIATKPPGFQPR
jgi:hypothetical protein